MTRNNDRWVVWRNGGESFTVFDNYNKAHRARGWLDTIAYKTPAQIAELKKYGREYVKVEAALT